MEKELSLLRRRRAAVLVRDNNSVLILVVLLAACFLFVDGYVNGFYNVLVYSSVYGAVCIGLGLVMITGNIDLSVGFQASLSGVVMVALFNVVYAGTGSVAASMLAGVLGAFIAGALCGLFNGFVIAKIGVSPLIATIATNYLFKGLVYNYARTSFPPAETEAVKAIVKTRIFGLRWLTPSVLLLFVMVALVGFWLYKTRFGNSLYIVGDNPEAAAYSGISVSRTVLTAYIICGVFAAICGVLMVSSDGYAIYTQGTSLSTFPISCCVIGGIKMAGGKGTALHMLLGILIMRAISTMMSVMFLPTDMVNLITGVLLIVVLVIDRFTSKKEVD